MRLRYLFYFLIIVALLIISDQSAFFDARNGMALKKNTSQGLPALLPQLSARLFEKMLPRHEVKKDPGPYDWLAHHPEPGQTFKQYILSNPSVPDENQKIIYIVRLGDFDQKRDEIISKTATMVGAFYQLPVKFLKSLSLSVVPEDARRIHPQTGDKQILTRTVIEDILIPLMPRDAFCLIAFTSSDLWPGEGWNFVFGEASLYDRVGIWSIYRNGDPHESPEAYDLCLMRTIKTGLHEIGHMFSMMHCVYFECLMNGSNHRKESDERPVWLCPVCLRKLSWALKMDEEEILSRFADMMHLFENNGFSDESGFYHEILGHLN